MHILICSGLNQLSPVSKLHLDTQETKWDFKPGGLILGISGDKSMVLTYAVRIEHKQKI